MAPGTDSAISSAPLTPEQLNAISEHISRHRPEWVNLSLSNPTLINTGWESEIIAVDAEYTLSGIGTKLQLVLRLFISPCMSWVAHREAVVMQVLHRLKYPVPEVFASDADGIALDRPFLAVEMVKGECLSRLFDNADPAPQKMLTAAFFDGLASLHRLDPRAVAASLGEHVAATAHDHTVSMIDDFESRLGKGCSVSFNAVFTWLRERLPFVSSAIPTIIHGDYHGYNILVKPDYSITVLDWSQVRIGDPRYDLAWTLILSGGLESPDKRAFVIDGYLAAGGKPVDDLEFFDVMAALLRLIVFTILFSTGPERLGLRANARDEAKHSQRHFMLLYEQLVAITGIRVEALELLISSLSS